MTLGPGGAGLVQQRMAGVGLDHDDAPGPERLREPLQHGDRHAVQPGEDGRVPDQAGPHPVHRLAPQDRRHGQRPGQRGSQADRAADLVGQRQRHVAGSPGGRTGGLPTYMSSTQPGHGARRLAGPARGQRRRGEDSADQHHGHDRGDAHDLRGQPPRVPVAQQRRQPQRQEDQRRRDVAGAEPDPPPRLRSGRASAGRRRRPRPPTRGIPSQHCREGPAPPTWPAGSGGPWPAGLDPRVPIHGRDTNECCALQTQSGFHCPVAQTAAIA